MEGRSALGSMASVALGSGRMALWSVPRGPEFAETARARGEAEAEGERPELSLHSDAPRLILREIRWLDHLEDAVQLTRKVSVWKFAPALPTTPTTRAYFPTPL